MWYGWFLCQNSQQQSHLWTMLLSQAEKSHTTVSEANKSEVEKSQHLSILWKRGGRRGILPALLRAGDKKWIINDHAIHSSNVTCSCSPFVFNNIKFNQSTAVCVQKLNQHLQSITCPTLSCNSCHKAWLCFLPWGTFYKVLNPKACSESKLLIKDSSLSVCNFLKIML